MERDPFPRRLLLALLVFGLVGIGVELILISHYEDSSQLIPIFVIALALSAAVGHAWAPTRLTVRVFQGAMVLLVSAGALGVLLHYRGSVEFQLESDATLSAWSLFKKVMRAKFPPVLAPGIMLQLGFLGLLQTYRHPALLNRGDFVAEK